MSFGVSRIKAVGVAIVAAIPLAIGSPAVVSALTKEEASRCRAMRNYIERRDCFESLREEFEGESRRSRKGEDRQCAITLGAGCPCNHFRC